MNLASFVREWKKENKMVLKKGVWIVLGLLVSISCSKKKEELQALGLSFNTFPQEWRLVKMTGSFEGSESTGEAMEWQESYVFNADKSFTKIRSFQDFTISASGTFAIAREEGRINLQLDYAAPSPLIGSCYSAENREYLYMDTENDGTTLTSTWWACDGPGLFYQRMP